jgi:iron complex transport system substrate-binding protein
MRICSLLPSATEILYALGLGDSVVGVTHECDFPPDATTKPALIRPRVDPQAAASEIDRQVSELVARGESIYAVDAELLGSLAPDLIITQDLCHVCAASPDDLATALTRLPKKPRVLALTPHSLRDVWDDVRKIGDATQRRREAQALSITLEQRGRCGRGQDCTGQDATTGAVRRVAGPVLRRRALGAGNGGQGGRARCFRGVRGSLRSESAQRRS